MSYAAEISRANPACFLFLIDQSWSMSDPFGNSESGTKADEVARTINRIVQEIIARCSSGEEVRRYFKIGVIGYGGAMIGSALAGGLSGQDLVWIDDLDNNPIRIDEIRKKVPDGAGGLAEMTIPMPIWFDAVANGGTPMVAAFQKTKPIIQQWVADHPSSYPPIIINITDGESTDGDPSALAAELRGMETEDGPALLFSLHLSSNKARSITLPSTEDGLPDRYAVMLYRKSSELPTGMREVAQEFGYATANGSRAFAFNAKLEDMIGFLNIGTRPSNMR